jgi:hypothetical protein
MRLLTIKGLGARTGQTPNFRRMGYESFHILTDSLEEQVACANMLLCPESIRPWAGKTKFCICVVTVPNPLQSRPLVTPHT